MKGKRYPTEDKMRILRETDRGEKRVLDICREARISEVSFHRWNPRGSNPSSREQSVAISGTGKFNGKGDFLKLSAIHCRGLCHT